MTRTHMMYKNQNPNYDIPIQIFEGPKVQQRQAEKTKEVPQLETQQSRPSSAAAQLKYKKRNAEQGEI